MARCIVILGGSFDPVHNGHIELAEYFGKHLPADEIRIIPAGNPWQKEGKLAPAQHRVAMIQCAFAEHHLSILLDDREVLRPGVTYTVDTLRELRTELGEQTSIVFLIGADQVRNLQTWRNWQQIFDYAHICAASRPGYPLDATQVHPEVWREFSRRAASLEQIRSSPRGLTHITHDLAVEIAATHIRTALRLGELHIPQIPGTVLDYIHKFHLYKE